jgi:hypothetical protein
LLVFLVGTLRQVHIAHAAGAQLADDAIGAEPLAFHRHGRRAVSLAIARVRAFLVPIRRVQCVVTQGVEHHRQQGFIVAAALAHESRALVRAEGLRSMHDIADCVGIFGHVLCQVMCRRALLKTTEFS